MTLSAKRMKESFVEKVIVHNRCRCKKCGAVLESKHRYDFVSCPCGVFTDGGLTYIRRGWPNGKYEDWVEDLDVFETTTLEARMPRSTT